MAERTEFLPLGGDPQATDVSGTSPTSEVRNFVPVVVSPSLSGKKQLKFQKRRGYQSSIASTDQFYKWSQGLHWTGLPSTGTSPSTSRGAIVFTEERSGVDLRLKSYTTTMNTLGTFGTADYNCIGIQETLISNVANLTLNVRLTSSPWTQKILFFPNGGALTEVTDADLPTGIIGCGVHMDGYYFYAANSSAGSNIWNLDINSLSAQTATSFIAAQSTPDTLVGLARIKTYVLALGTRSIEFFQNVGASSGSPLQRIENAAIKIGVLHGNAIQALAQSLLFVGVSEDGVGVYMLSGSTATKVSNALVDAALSKSADSALNTPLAGGLTPITSTFMIMFCGVTTYYGTTFAVLLIDTTMYAYAPSINEWMTIKLGTNSALIGASFFPVGAQQLFLPRQSETNNAAAYFTDITSLTTSGGDNQSGSVTNFEAYIATSPIAHGTPNRKFASKIEILGDVQSVATPIIVSYSDDNGATFTTHGTIDMSVNPPVPLTRLGSYVRRIYKFSNTSAAGCGIDAVRETFTVGTS